MSDKNEEKPADKKEEKPAEPREVEERAQSGKDEDLPVPEARWTIMIYMASDNTLADYCLLALSELRLLQTENRVHVTVQLDPQDGRMRTQRMVINKKGKKQGAGSAGSPGMGALNAPDQDGKPGLARDVVKFDKGPLPGGKVPCPSSLRRQAAARVGRSSDETDTADPKTLFDFISWAVDNCPAQRYMLVLAGHSAGVEDGFLMKDENPPGSMSFEDLVAVLQVVRDGKDAGGLGIELDIIGMDACLMNMAEICFELQGLTSFIVGSQGYVPNPGWPYRRIVAALQEKVLPLEIEDRKEEAEKFARNIVNEYIAHYLETSAVGGLSVDLGALDVDASGEVAGAVGQLVEVIEPKMREADPAFRRSLVYAHWATQSYNGELFVDLHDFCAMLREVVEDADVVEACVRVQRAVEAMVTVCCFCGIDSQYSNGLSIYFPWSNIFETYNQLAFTENSRWMAFLERYVEATRRVPRGGPVKEAEPKVTRSYLLSETPDEVRRDPPQGHGPGGFIHSMRNPPREWTSKGASECTGEEVLRKVFESLL
jgi:hypothetical protein